MKGYSLFLNAAALSPSTPYASPALDLIRKECGLMGTKEGCREGDCGACAVLVGGFEAEGLRYRALPSCLLASGYLADRHLITIEGLGPGLSPVQKAFLEENASQCGFCSPGFIMALTGWICEPEKLNLPGAMAAVDGNLCRCTGYGAIRRASERLVAEFSDLPLTATERLKALANQGVLPQSVFAYGAWIQERKAAKVVARVQTRDVAGGIVAGGTDFYVRTPEPALGFSPVLAKSLPELEGMNILEIQGRKALRIGAAATVREFFSSPLVREWVPGIEKFESSFASTLIRNLATLGGNIANASPVGDLTSMLLALDAELEIKGRGIRRIPLKAFFLGYKKIDLLPGEIIVSICIPLAESPLRFSFAKITKRENLDIAAVNIAIAFHEDKGRFHGVQISAGGVAPTPLLLAKAMEELEGRPIPPDGDTVNRVAEAAMVEVSPIGDVRGSAEYRRKMTGRLVQANFLNLFPNGSLAKELYP
ncbi:MAG: xanthine dehydrogenase small subunit [Spirochaetes bacterium]|nr:MAG: xanthine dehydrogenase small subunit [Spirochaetota bacterium]